MGDAASGLEGCGRPLPADSAGGDRLLTFTIVRPGTDRQPLSLPDLEDFKRSSHTLDGLVSMFGWSANLTGRGDAERLTAMRVSADYFEVTGAQVQLGRPLAPDDEPRPSALISHGLWQRRFGGALDVVGQSLVLNGEAFTIVGVLQSDFVALVRDAEIVVPHSPAVDPRPGQPRPRIPACHRPPAPRRDHRAGRRRPGGDGQAAR